MRREIYFLEMRNKEHRFFFARKNTTRVKISIVVLIFATIINLALMASIKTSLETNSVYYLIEVWDTGFHNRLYPSCGPRVPLYACGYDFKATFHMNFWIMTALFLGTSTGYFTKDYEEQKKMIYTFHSINTANILVGVMRGFMLVEAMQHNNLMNPLILTVFLGFYPLMLSLPIQLMTLQKKKPFREFFERENRSMMKIGQTSIAFIFTIGIALIYLAVDVIV